MPEVLEIKSHKGLYQVEFTQNVFTDLGVYSSETTHLIVDDKVYSLYKHQFDQHLKEYKILQIHAEESNKNIDRISSYVSSLMENKTKLNHTLIAIGGGITQDITCFIAATLFRGMQWVFVPTTLLAQADSCIGSKSSINVGPFKNLMGTFTPPQKIYLDTQFLETLAAQDIASGIGEILKVHMIKGIPYFEKSLISLESMKTNSNVLLDFIKRSLEYKKELIEIDEFDKGPRNVMNYGHSYGHAIESATNFEIPHGVAVALGMDMANYQSFKMGRIQESQFLEWHTGLLQNYKDFSHVSVKLDVFLAAIRKDKKNVGEDLSLILVQNEGPIEKVKVPADEFFIHNCQEFLQNYKMGTY